MKHDCSGFAGQYFPDVPGCFVPKLMTVAAVMTAVVVAEQLSGLFLVQLAAVWLAAVQLVAVQLVAVQLVAVQLVAVQLVAVQLAAVRLAPVQLAVQLAVLDQSMMSAVCYGL